MFTVSISGWGISARQIMHNNRQLPGPSSSKGTIKLVIRNQNVTTTSLLRIYTKKFGAQTRSRINFLRPGRMQFLIYSLPGGATRQWVKLSSGRIRRVASGNRSASWANSHFYYEDLRTYSLNNYRFTKLSDTAVQDYKKKRVPCYRILAVSQFSGSVYSKRILFIEKKTWQIRRVQFYQRGRHTKTLTNYLFKKINGINTPRLMYMEPVGQKGSYSSLLLQRIQFNLPLSSRLFRRSSF